MVPRTSLWILRSVLGYRVETKAVRRALSEFCERMWKARLRQRAIRLAAVAVANLVIHSTFCATVMAQLPTGANVVAGNAVISATANQLDVNATSTRTIVNWNQFNIGVGQTANFNLPDSSSAILNRVTSIDMPSAINGALNSNGHVYVVNPSGIVVGSGGIVNTNAFVASTLDIANDKFMAGGALTFSGDSAAAIVNNGTINTGDGGAHLIANQIANNGTITSIGGNITLSGGGSVTLNNGVTYVQPTLDTLASGISPTAGLIQNTGMIRATGAATSGGEVYLVNPNGKILHDGTIAAHREPTALAAGLAAYNDGPAASAVGSVGGHVQLEADEITLAENSTIDATGTLGGGTVLVGGNWQGGGTMSQATTVTMEAGATIDASATESGDGGTIVLWSDVTKLDSVTKAFGTLLSRAGQLFGNGGQIETSGHVIETDGVIVNAGAANGSGGMWLIDPFNYIINSSAASNIVSALNSGTSVTVTTTANNPSHGSSGNSGDLGDITVTSNIVTGAMAGDATLTLRADRHIQVADTAVIDATQNGNTRKLNVQLWADQDNSGDGINIINSSSIRTNGGSLTFGNGSTATIGGQSVLVGGDVYFSSAVAQTFDTGGGNLTVHGETILANSSASGVTLNTGGGNVLLLGVLNSGNQYTYVDGPDNQHSWDWARTDARNGTAGGAALGDSYLVTITSRLENAIAGITAGYRGSWHGAHRANPASSNAWTWVDGPEAGQHFFTQSGNGGGNGGGTALPGWYSNFGAGEPNGALDSSGESGGQFFGSAGQWNDLPKSFTFAASQASQYDVLGYVRETNLAPSALSINAGSGSVIVQGGIGGGKALSSLNVTSSGTTINGNSLITTGAQTYSSGLSLNGSGNVSIQSTGINVGGNALFATSSGTTTLGSNITSTGSQSYTGSVSLPNDRTLTAINNGITFGGSIDSSGGTRSLITNTGTGATTFNGIVGGTSTLSSLNVSGTSNVNANITTSGNQTYGSTITIGGSGNRTLTGNQLTTQAIVGGTRDMTLIADSLNLQGNVASTGSITLPPRTSGTAIGIGTGNGTFIVDNTTLGRLQDGFSSITIGDTTAGALSVGGINTLSDDLILRAGSAANLTVSGPIAWTSNNALTLAAGNDIWILDNIDVGGAAASLNLLFGGSDGTSAPTTGRNYNLDLANQRSIEFANTSASLKIGNVNYTLIDSRSGFTGMSSSGNFALARGLDLSGTTDNTAIYNGTFSGRFDGLGHAANGMIIRNSTGGNLGLFGQLNGATVRHLGVTNFNINTSSTSGSTVYRIGGLVGNVGGAGTPLSSITTIDGVWSTGVISTAQGGTQQLYFGGGLVGSQNGGFMNMTRSFSSANVSTQGSYSGNLSTGGLVGDIGINTHPFSHTQTTQSVVDFDISRSYATGSIVQGTFGAYFGSGGLVGVIFTSGGSLTDSFSTGNVVGTGSFGGIAGFALTGTFARNYTTQSTVGAGSVGTASSYNGSQLAAATNNGTQLPSGWSPSIWAVGAQPTLIVLPRPATALYVSVTGGTSVYGDLINPTFLLVTASGTTVALGTGLYAGIDGVTGTGRFTIGDIARAQNHNGVSYLSGLSLTGTEANLFTLNPFSTSGSYIVTPRSITAQLANPTITKVYDGNTSAPSGFTPSFSFTNLVTGDNVTLNLGSSVFNTSQVTTADRLTISALSLAGITGSNGSLLSDYALSSTSTFSAATITPRPLVVTGLFASDKIYDGLTTSQINTGGATLSGRVGSDAVSLSSATGAFATRNVGNNINVSISGLGLTGAAASNYSFTPPTSVTGNITPKSLTVSGITAANKVYDALTSATVSTSGINLNGLVFGDSFTVSSSGTFANKNVADGKTVTLSNTFGGADLNNYSITNQTTTLANITPKLLTISGITADNKIYDSNTSATLSTSGIVFGGIVNGDSLTASATGTFNNKHVADGKTVTLSTTYGGTDLNNYSITDQATALANVTPKSLTISGITAANKVYDALTSVTVSTSGVDYGGLLTGDDFTVSSTGSFANKNVANGKTVTLSNTFGGTDLNNYAITDQTSTLANITAKSIVVSGLTAMDRIYDGTTAAIVDNSGVQFNGIVTGDDLSMTSAGVFSDKNVADNKTVLLTNNFSGTDLGNYTVSDQGTTTANITPKALTISGVIANNKTYDGNTVATSNTSSMLLDGLVIGDHVHVDVVGAFHSKNVGTNQTVTLTLTEGGADVNNYAFTKQQTSIADILRLGSVTWIGGASGNWSDPANWAGGAIPDLANVANVIIPNGVTPIFDSNVSGPVDIDSLTGGNFQMDSGTLNVAHNATLADYTQNGGLFNVGGLFTFNHATVNNGTLNVTGNTTGGTFTQSGGTVGFGGDLDVTEYEQTDGDTTIGGTFTFDTGTVSGGTLDVTGNTTGGTFTQNGGNVGFGGDLDVTTYRQTDGDTTIGGTFTFDTGTVSGGTLDVTGNTTGGTFTQNGGTVGFGGDLDVTEYEQTDGDTTIGGTFTFGTGTVSGGSLDVTGNTTGGTFTQNGGTVGFGGDLDVTEYEQTDGDTTIGGMFTFDTGTVSGGTLDVTGNTTGGTFTQNGGTVGFGGDLDVTEYEQTDGDTTIGGMFTFDTGTVSGGTLDVPGNTTGGTFTQNGGTVGFGGDLDVTTYEQTDGDTTIDGTFTFDTGTVSGGSLDVTGNTTGGTFTQNGGTVGFRGDLDVTEYEQTDGDTTIGGTFTFGTGTVSGGSLDVTGNTTGGTFTQNGGTVGFGGDLDVTEYEQTDGDTTIGGAFTFDIGTVSGGSLDVTGNTTGGTFTQNGGTVGFGGALNVSDFEQNNGILGVGGRFGVTNSFVQTGTGTINVDGDVNVNQQDGDLTVRNLTGRNIRLLSPNGGVTLGDVTARNNAEVITGNGGINQLPSTRLVIDGSSTFNAFQNGKPAEVDLSNPNNDFQGPISGRGSKFTVKDIDGQVQFGNVVSNELTKKGQSVTSQTVLDTNTRYTDGQNSGVGVQNTVERFGFTWLQRIVAWFQKSPQGSIVTPDQLSLTAGEVMIKTADLSDANSPQDATQL